MTATQTQGTRAVLKYARFSAYKAREVLDLIRNKSVAEAAIELDLCERGPSDPIAKLLASAIANASHNDGIPADELFVSECYADEGPTMRRFRPRARGRATRIRKRSCHITVVVSRYSTDTLDARRARAEETGRPTADAAANRARRVARSKKAEKAEEAAAAQAEELAAAQAEEAAAAEAAGASDSAAAESGAGDSDAGDAGVADLAASVDASDTDAADGDAAEDSADDAASAPQALAGSADGDAAADEAAGDDAAAPYGPGSHAPLPDDEQPEGYPIKGNADSMLYHVPGGSHYGRTIAEVWFATEEDAERAGFAAPKSAEKKGDA